MSLQIPPLEHFPPSNTYKRADDVISFCNAYMAKHFPFDTDSDRAHFIAMGIPACACKVFSFATSHAKMCKVAVLMAFYFATDDLLDRCGMKVDERALSALLLPTAGRATEPAPSAVDRHPATGADPLLRQGDPGVLSWFDVFAELHGNLCADMPPVYYDWMVRGMKEYFLVQKVDPGCGSIGDWVERRLSDTGFDILYSHICYAMELAITTDELADPLVSRCQRLGAEIGALMNDESSYEKEVRDGTAQNNLITRIMEWVNCGEDDARCQVRSMIAERQAELRAACVQAVEVPHLSTDAKSFVMAIPYMLGATIWLHQHSSRYVEGRGSGVEEEP